MGFDKLIETFHPPLEIKKERGKPSARFLDNYHERCIICEPNDTTKCLILGANREPMYLTRGMVAELLPILTRFTETGTITETDK
jgi:hypothetical protein